MQTLIQRKFGIIGDGVVFLNNRLGRSKYRVYDPADCVDCSSRAEDGRPALSKFQDVTS